MKTKNSFELEARYDSRASFYGKARVEVAENGDMTLYSYNTPVAICHDGKVERLSMADYSQTTRRHVREFERQFGNA